jgi:hypothetical protein
VGWLATQIQNADNLLTAGRNQRYGSTGLLDIGVAGTGQAGAIMKDTWAQFEADNAAAAAADAQKAAAALQHSFEAHMQAGQSAIREAVRIGLSDPISAELSAGAKRSVAIASAWGVDMAAALGAGEPAWMAAVKGFGADMVSGMTNSAQLGYIMGVLNSKMIADGLKSGKPGIQTETRALVNTLLTTLDALYGPAWLASYDFGSGIVNAAAKAIAEGQMRAFGKASPGMAPVVNYAAAPKMDLSAYDQAIKAMKDMAAGAGASTSSAAAIAKAALKNAFDTAKEAARSFFDLLHERNLKAIEDARNLANASATGPVSQARAQLAAEQAARQEAALRAALTGATNPADQSAAQQALSDFLAEQNITKMQEQADAQVKANDAIARAATEAENKRAKGQTAALDHQKTAAGIAQTLVAPKSAISAAAAAGATGGGTIIVQIDSAVIARIIDERLFVRGALTTAP